MKKLLSTLIVALAAIQPSFADSENGKELINEKCVSCHMVGGDHTLLYKSKDRKVKDLGRLKGMVSMCTQNLNIEWFPEDEADAVNYLNDQYYHFKK